MARGDGSAERRSRNSWDDPPVTVTPGMNLREASLGVVSVWMNIVRPTRQLVLSLIRKWKLTLLYLARCRGRSPEW